MKILHVLDLSIPDLKGYAIRAKGIVESQKKIGLKPVCLTSFRQTNFGGMIDTINQIPYYRSGRYNPSWNLPVISQLFEIKALSKRIDEIIKKENIDLLHAHSPIICGMAALRSGKKHQLPVVYEIRAFWEDAAASSGKCKQGDMRYKITKRLETFTCQRVDKVVAICKGIKDDLVNRNIDPNKITIVPNGIALDNFKKLTKSEKLIRKHKLEGHFVLGFIGSFFKFEGVDLLVYLMDKLKDLPVKMILVGDGESYETVNNLTNSLGLDDQIILTGRVPHDKVDEYYSVMDVLVYPRYSERITELTTPLKPLEAMAMGKNVICSSVGGLREIVPEGCGDVFEAGNCVDLMNKVLQLMNNREKMKQMSNNAMNFVKTREWEKIVNIYHDIYKIQK